MIPLVPSVLFRSNPLLAVMSGRGVSFFHQELWFLLALFACLCWLAMGLVFYSGNRGNRWIYIRNSLFVLLVLSLVFCGGYVVTRKLITRADLHELSDARNHWALMDSRLTAELDATIRAAGRLARHPELPTALTNGAGGVRALLTTFALEEGMDVCFIADNTGRILHTSDRTEYYNLSGRDLSEHPFFGPVQRQGWGGGFLSGPAGEPAYLACHVVSGNPEVLAGILFRLDRLQVLMNGMELCMVCHEDGHILLSGEVGLTGERLWAASPNAAAALLPEKPVSGQVVTYAGEQRLVVIGRVPHTNWLSVMLHSMERVQGLAQMGLLLTFLLLLLILLLHLSGRLLERAELQVRERDRRFRELVERANSVILRRDRYGRILFINRYGLNLFGFKDKEITGRNMVGALLPAHGSMGQDMRSYIEEITEHPERFAVYDEENVRRDGTTIHMAWSLRPLRDAQGVVQEFLCIGTDISFLKEHEDHRAQMERQMQHMQKLESLGVMAGGIAHEFNNLLMGIIGNTSMAALELPESSELRETFSDIEKAARRAAELTEQLLAYSGKGQYQVSLINLSSMIRDMGQLIEVSLARNTHIRYSLEDNLPGVEADASQIRQLIINLISNAVEAMTGLDGVLSIRTGVRTCTRDELRRMVLGEDREEGTYVTIEVSDQGHGMKADVVNHAFEPFFSTRFAGRGLGLSAVLGIVRGHKGAIEIQSQIGSGTVVRVFLPASENQQDAQHGAVVSNGSWRGEGLVLVADDEEVVRKLSARMLQRLGFEVIQAANGTEAVELFTVHARELKLVLLDVTMPQMNGLEACRKIQCLAPKMPIILSSGYSAEAASPALNLPEGVLFVHKPYRLQELRQVLQSLLA